MVRLLPAERSRLRELLLQPQQAGALGVLPAPVKRPEWWSAGSEKSRRARGLLSRLPACCGDCCFNVPRIASVLGPWWDSRIVVWDAVARLQTRRGRKGDDSAGRVHTRNGAGLRDGSPPRKRPPAPAGRRDGFKARRPVRGFKGRCQKGPVTSIGFWHLTCGDSAKGRAMEQGLLAILGFVIGFLLRRLLSRDPE